MEEDLGIAESCFRYVKHIFDELEEFRAFELLRSGLDRSKYLLVKEAKIIAMTCTHAALKRKELVDIGRLLFYKGSFLCYLLSCEAKSYTTDKTLFFNFTIINTHSFQRKKSSLFHFGLLEIFHTLGHHEEILCLT